MKLRNLLFGMAIAATILVALGAKAQPVNLTCMYIEGRGMGNELRVTFDESAGTAVCSREIASKAVFTDATIEWGFDRDIRTILLWKNYYSLNRATGTLTTYSVFQKDEHTDRTADRATYKCTIAQKQF